MALVMVLAIPAWVIAENAQPVTLSLGTLTDEERKILLVGCLINHDRGVKGPLGVSVRVLLVSQRHVFQAEDMPFRLSKNLGVGVGRAEALPTSIIFGDMRGENGIFEGANRRFAVKNAFPAPPSPGNPAGFQKAGSPSVEKVLFRRPERHVFQAEDMPFSLICGTCAWETTILGKIAYLASAPQVCYS